MIKLRADYSKRLSCSYSIFVSFPYNPLCVQVMRSMNQRVWIAEQKEWEIGQDCYNALLEALNCNNLKYDETYLQSSIEQLKIRVEKNKAIQETDKEIDISILDEVEFKTQPRDYQLEGIAFGLENDRFLLADEQGLGKSLQCLNIARLKRGGKHCLIIVGYDSLQFNWVNEVLKHSNEQAHVIGQQEYKSGSKKGKFRKGTMKDRIDDLLNIDEIDSFFLITSISTLRYCEKQKYIDKNGKERTNKIYVIANIIEDLCKRGIIGRVIIDESQVCKNITSQQTEALLKIRSCPYKIAATGTPLMNKHADLYPLMYWLGKTQQNYWSFRDEYCIMGGFKNKQIIGNKNAGKLNEQLSKFMLRRRKDILDLPPKIIIDEILEMDLKQQVLYDKYKSLMKQQLINMKGNMTAILSAYIKLRQITCHPQWVDEKYKDSVKFERVHQLMNEITENEQKAIIFSNWATPIEWLYEELKIYNPAKITGDTKDRMEEVERFQNDPNCKVILGTVGAMGTGLTLTAASNVIFIDEPWNRALKDQCTDRAHRIGTKSSVNIYTLLCKDTIDDRVHKKVFLKGIMQDEVIDGILVDDIDEILS